MKNIIITVSIFCFAIYGCAAKSYYTDEEAAMARASHRHTCSQLSQPLQECLDYFWRHFVSYKKYGQGPYLGSPPVRVRIVD